MKKFILILIILFCICGCNTSNSSNKNQLSSDIQSVLDENNYLILDVRTKEEYDTGHLSNAINISYEDIDETIDLDKTKTILVYCASGARSAIALKSLTDLGYTVYNLGGFDDIDLPKE